jgi:VWFA-related protein
LFLQRYFLGSFGFALLALFFALGIGSFASAPPPPAEGKSVPGTETDLPDGETVARSDDGVFVLRLLSPRGSYLFGRQQIRVEVEAPSGDPVKTLDFFVDGRLRRTATKPPFEVEADFGDEIERHTLLILGQTQGGRAVRLSRVSRAASLQTKVEVSLVTVPVSVVGADGRFVEGLDLSDFTLQEDDQPQTIVHFDRDPTPVSLAVALDASDSMKGSLWSAQKAANDFIASLPSFYKVCVIGFNDSVTLERDFTFDRRGLALAVNNLKPAGRTALYDTLRAAGTQLRGRGDRRVAVIFTDGGETVYGDDETGRRRLEDSLQAAREAGVTFYSIAFGPQAASDLLRRIASETGGAFYDSRDPGALPSIYRRIGEDLVHQYALSYYPSHPVSEGGWRRIAVRVNRSGVTVRARPGYLASH